MNFLYDLTASQPNVEGQYHGGGKYAKKIFIALANHQFDKENIYALYDSERDLDGEIRRQANKSNITLIDSAGKNLEDIVKTYSIDRIFSALASEYFNKAKLTCEYYSTIHGLRFIELPIELESLKYTATLKEKIKTIAKIVFQNRFNKQYLSYYQYLLKNSNVITVSNHTKYSILANFPETTTDIPVFYSPDVTEFDDPYSSGASNEFSENGYFLMIMGNRWMKNNLRSAIALDQLFSERKDIRRKVIVTGVSTPDMYLKYIKNKEYFKFYGYVEENFLKVLHKNAFAFIYMTLNEGFGYPPLESMKTGVPVITSPFTSIFEICEDSVLYSNPYSVLEIKNRILQLFDKETYDRLSQKAIDRYALVRNRQDEDLSKLVKYLLR